MIFVSGLTKKRLLGSFILVFGILFIGGCAGGKAGSMSLDGRENYETGLELLEKKKYLRAQEEFNQAVISGAHTEWGDDASFYLAESYFLNKEYLLAISEYERMIRRMPFSEFIERARYRICECYIAESPKYFHDQNYTVKAMDSIQDFLDDFPNSEFRADAIEANKQLREKLGKKAYESGILYLKMDEPGPALIAFEEVITNYYDTESFAMAFVESIHAYCMLPDIEQAQAYYSENKEIIDSNGLSDQAEAYIQAAINEKKRREK